MRLNNPWNNVAEDHWWYSYCWDDVPRKKKIANSMDAPACWGLFNQVWKNMNIPETKQYSITIVPPSRCPHFQEENELYREVFS